MNTFLTLVITSFLATSALAQSNDDAAAPETDTAAETGAETGAEEVAEPVTEMPAFGPLNASEVSLDDFKWLKRPIVVFADTPADPRFQEQMELLLARPDELIKRDVVVIVDTDPRAKSAVRTKLRPRGFMLTLIGKDGGVKLRKPSPWDVREITRSIDKMPLRKQEIREQKAISAEQ